MYLHIHICVHICICVCVYMCIHTHYFLTINMSLVFGRWKHATGKAKCQDRLRRVVGRVWTEQAEAHILILLLTKCVTQGKLLNFSKPQVFSSVKLTTIFFRVVVELAITFKVLSIREGP